VGDAGDGAQLPFGQARERNGRGAQGDQRPLLLDRAELQRGASAGKLAAADVQHPHLLRPVALRAVGDDPDDVDAAHQRHVEELIAALHRSALAAAQHVVDVELDIEADRQLAAQIDGLEHAGLLERHGADEEAAPGDAARAQRQRRGEDVAGADPGGIERSKQIAPAAAPFEQQPRFGGAALFVRADEGLEAGVKEVAGGPKVVAGGEAGAARVVARLQNDVESGRTDQLVRRFDAQNFVISLPDIAAERPQPRRALQAGLDGELGGRPEDHRQPLRVDLSRDRGAAPAAGRASQKSRSAWSAPVRP
jgi:hypothetical protein